MGTWETWLMVMDILHIIDERLLAATPSDWFPLSKCENDTFCIVFYIEFYIIFYIVMPSKFPDCCFYSVLLPFATYDVCVRTILKHFCFNCRFWDIRAVPIHIPIAINNFHLSEIPWTYVMHISVISIFLTYLNAICLCVFPFVF